MGRAVSLLGLGSSWLGVLSVRVLPAALGSDASGELFMQHFPTADMCVSGMFFQWPTLILKLTSSGSQPAVWEEVGQGGTSRRDCPRASQGLSPCFSRVQEVSSGSQYSCDPQTVDTSPL